MKVTDFQGICNLLFKIFPLLRHNQGQRRRVDFYAQLFIFKISGLPVDIYRLFFLAFLDQNFIGAVVFDVLALIHAVKIEQMKHQGSDQKGRFLHDTYIQHAVSH